MEAAAALEYATSNEVAEQRGLLLLLIASTAVPIEAQIHLFMTVCGSIADFREYIFHSESIFPLTNLLEFIGQFLLVNVCLVNLLRPQVRRVWTVCCIVVIIQGCILIVSVYGELTAFRDSNGIVLYIARMWQAVRSDSMGTLAAATPSIVGLFLFKGSPQRSTIR